MDSTTEDSDASSDDGAFARGGGGSFEFEDADVVLRRRGLYVESNLRRRTPCACWSGKMRRIEVLFFATILLFGAVIALLVVAGGVFEVEEEIAAEEVAEGGTVFGSGEDNALALPDAGGEVALVSRDSAAADIAVRISTSCGEARLSLDGAEAPPALPRGACCLASRQWRAAEGAAPMSSELLRNALIASLGATGKAGESVPELKAKSTADIAALCERGAAMAKAAAASERDAVPGAAPGAPAPAPAAALATEAAAVALAMEAPAAPLATEQSRATARGGRGRRRLRD